MLGVPWWNTVGVVGVSVSRLLTNEGDSETLETVVMTSLGGWSDKRGLEQGKTKS